MNRPLLDRRLKVRAWLHQRLVDSRGALIQLPAKRTGLGANGYPEIFAPEAVLAERTALLGQESSEKKPTVSAVAFSRSHDGSSSAHAVQNGSVRLHAVDSIAKRACGQRARIGRSALIRSLVRRAASSATIQPSTVNPRIESSVLGSASTRDPFLSSSS